MRKLVKWRWVAMIAIIAAIAIPSLIRLCREDRITLQNYNRIQDGMALAEIRAVLGPEWSDSLLEPAMPRKGEYCGRRLDFTEFGEERQGAFLVHTFVWVGSRNVIVVTFGENWTLWDKSISDIGEEPRPSFLDRVHAKLRSLIR